MGDGVVAVFGADPRREDDALRATRCAASMVAAVGAIWTDRQWAWDVRLQMRIGVRGRAGHRARPQPPHRCPLEVSS